MEVVSRNRTKRRKFRRIDTLSKTIGNRARDIRRIFVHLTAAADQNSVAERKDTSEKKRKIDAISGCDATGIKTVRLRALAAL